MKVHVVYTFDGKWWTAEAPFLDGAFSQGRTRHSAERHLKSAVRDLLRTYADLGRPPPLNPVVEVEETEIGP